MQPSSTLSSSIPPAASTIILNFPTGGAAQTNGTIVLMATASVSRRTKSFAARANWWVTSFVDKQRTFADNTPCLCSKREPGARKVFRRRPSPEPSSFNPKMFDVREAEEKSTLAKMVHAVHKHKARRLETRSRLWNLF